MTPEKRAEIAERYGWQEGEREAMQRDISERQRRDAHDEAVAWAKAQNAARAEAERQSVEPNGSPEKRTATKPEAAMTDTAQIWETWVKAKIKASREASEVAMSGAVADVLGPIEEKHKAALDELRTEVTILRNEICQLRSEVKVRGALDDVQQRLDKIEQARQPLRTVGKALSA